MSSRNVLNSPHLQEFKNKKRKEFTRKFLIWAFLFLALVSLLSYLSRIKRLNIEDVQVSGSKVAEMYEIKDVVENSIASNYLWLYPKTNVLFYPRQQIEDDLREHFKVLKDIKITLEQGNTLSVVVTEREPAYTWCGKEYKTTFTEDTCYFMDDGGYIFAPAPYFSGDVYFRFFGPLNIEGTEVTGQEFMPEIFLKLISFTNVLKEMDLKPVSLFWSGGKDIEIYLTGNHNPKITLEKNFDGEIMAKNLAAALATEPLESQMKNKYNLLEYIDLRFGNKVYYRFSAQGGSASGGN